MEGEVPGISRFPGFYCPHNGSRCGGCSHLPSRLLPRPPNQQHDQSTTTTITTTNTTTSRLPSWWRLRSWGISRSPGLYRSHDGSRCGGWSYPPSRLLPRPPNHDHRHSTTTATTTTIAPPPSSSQPRPPPQHHHSHSHHHHHHHHPAALMVEGEVPGNFAFPGTLLSTRRRPVWWVGGGWSHSPSRLLPRPNYHHHHHRDFTVHTTAAGVVDGPIHYHASFLALPTTTIPTATRMLPRPPNHHYHHQPAAFVVEGEVPGNFAFPGTLPFTRRQPVRWMVPSTIAPPPSP